MSKNNRRNNDHQPIGNILKDFVQKNNLESGIHQVEVLDTWKRVMGPAINKYTTAIKFSNNTLYVQLSSSVLREELSYGTTKIIDNLNETIGSELIHKLVLR